MLQPGDFKIYNASAGAGKTYTLVKEFISILLQHENVYYFEHILAITFTNKAANEMKERIIEQLEELADIDAKSDDYLLSLAEELSLKPKDIQEKAKRILIAILHNYSKFSISTIDKFNLRLMKSFAQDLGLSMNFDVEMNTQEVIEESVDLLYSKIGENEALTKTIVGIAMDNMDDDKSWDIRKALTSETVTITNDRHLQELDRLRKVSLEDFSAYRKTLFQEVRILKSGYEIIAEEFFELMKLHGLSSDDLPGKSRSIASFFLKLKNNKDNAIIFPTDSNQKDMDGVFLDKVKNPSAEQIFPQIKELYNKVMLINNRLILLSSIQKNISSITLINEVEKSLDTLKKESNTLLINEFNTIISKNLQEQPAHFIYERIGSRYHHYFIDEFQDTSTLQWNNLQPLIENARSQTDTIMLVGDAKQSIYRWRGGNPAQMIRLIEHAEEEKIKVENLATNWRSHQNIIDFNNALYSFIAPQLNLPEFQQLYEVGNKQLTNKRTDGYVHIDFIEKKGNSKKEFNERNLALILEKIQQCVLNGFTLQEITILVRTNGEGVLVANHLTENNITVISNEALLLKNAYEIQLLEALYKITANPMDEQSKIHFLLVAYELNLFFSNDLTATIEQALNKKINGFIRLCKEVGIDLGFIEDENLALYDFTEKAIRALHLNRQATAYLMSFLDVILDFSARNESDLNSFLEFWSNAKDKASIRTPKGVDAVQIMTIHKSKGLEFPVVIVPFIDWTMNTKDKIWIPLEKEDDNPFESFFVTINKDLKAIKDHTIQAKIQEEENFTQLDKINTLYVATTRAKEQLYILALQPKPNASALTVSVYLEDFVKTKGESGQSIALYGSDQRTSILEELSSESLQLPLYSYDWSTKLIINTNSENAALKLERTEFANAIHLVLSKLNHREELEDVLALEKKRGAISSENIARIQHMMDLLMDHPELEPYFQKDLTVLNERDFIDADGAIFRADRVVIDAHNNCTIIDYKTGQTQTTHYIQVNQYADFFRSLGYTIQAKLLVYIDDVNEKITVVAVDQ